MSVFHTRYLSWEIARMRQRVSTSHPSTSWISLGVPSAAKFDNHRVSLCGTGFSSPADGCIAVWIARGAEAPYFWIFLSQFMKTLMMSSMNISPLPKPIVVMLTAISFACASGIDFSS